MSKIVKLNDERVVNLALCQGGVWAGRTAPVTGQLPCLPLCAGEGSLVHVYGRRNWALRRSGPFKRDKLLALLGIEPQLVDPTARIMCAVPTELSESLQVQRPST
jgi:hypothetical protein